MRSFHWQQQSALSWFLSWILSFNEHCRPQLFHTEFSAQSRNVKLLLAVKTHQIYGSWFCLSCAVMQAAQQNSKFARARANPAFVHQQVPEASQLQDSQEPSSTSPEMVHYLPLLHSMISFMQISSFLGNTNLGWTPSSDKRSLLRDTATWDLHSAISVKLA